MSEQTSASAHAGASRWSGKLIALLLVGAGVGIFLANTGPAGVVLWSVGLPIVMLAVGFDLVTAGQQRRRIAGAALVAMVVLAPLIGGAQLLAPEERRGNSGSRSREHYIGMVHGIERVRAEVRLTAGTLQIDSLDEDSDAIAAVAAEGEQEHELSRTDDIATVQIEHPLNAGDLDLQLTQRVPVELSILMGNGNLAPLNLEDVQLEKLSVTQTTGDLELLLPDQGRMTIEIANQFGDIELDIPDDLAVRIEANTTFGEIDVAERFEQRDGAYVSADGSDDAANHAMITINSTAGDIRLR